MSYLQRTSGVPSFTEAVISFWFRVPSESLGKIKYDGETDTPPVFNGILPLLVMGKEGREQGRYDPNVRSTPSMITEWTNETIYGSTATYLGEECLSYFTFSLGGYSTQCCLTSKITVEHTPYVISEAGVYKHVDYLPVYSPVPLPQQNSNPTCIGVDKDGHLYVNFQMAKNPKLTGQENFEYVTSITPATITGTSGSQPYSTGLAVTSRTYYENALGCTGLFAYQSVEGPTEIPGSEGTYEFTPGESHIDSFPPTPPETGKFYSGGYEGFSNNIEVSPDRWHHVLVSVELKTTKTHSFDAAGSSSYGYDGGSLLYIALDDKNYTKGDLSGDMWDRWGGDEELFGPNEVFPYMAWDIATSHYNSESTHNTPTTYELEDPEVPSGFIGIPAVSKYEDKVLRTEMAELQIWFGKSMDTGETDNRRLFIDKDGKPVKSAVAAKALGSPDILLHGSSNWKKGIIQGKLAPPTEEGKPPKPYFRPVLSPDAIVRWKPDPSLYGPQSPSEK